MLEVVYKVERALEYERIVPNIRRQLLSTMRTFGRRASARLRRIMRSSLWARNSPPWIAAKKTGKILYQTGHLTTSISSVVRPGAGEEFVSIEVGWPEGSSLARPGGKGRGLQSVIGILTGGRVWMPTKESKAAFWAQVPSEWKNKHATTPGNMWNLWEIPKRDFMDEMRKDPETLAMFSKYAARAVAIALRRSQRR